MMYYHCLNCNKPIRKPYPSKKYCGAGCRDSSRRERVEEQEHAFWNSILPMPSPTDAPPGLWQMAEAARAGFFIRSAAPAGTVGYRVGCRRIGAETYTVHWFPTQRQRPSGLFQLEPIEAPIDIPCPSEYVVAYFDAAGALVEVPRYKLTLRAYAVGILWSEGDRRLLLERKPQ